VSIRDDLAAVERRIAEACARAGRRREEVTLIAVSKTKPAAMLDEAIAAGVTELGENRVQEARDKKPLVRGSARWHLIGHLQSNKAKDAVRLFDVIQTIDTSELAEKVARAAAAAGKVQDILIEVNIGLEPQKSGVHPAEIDVLVAAIDDLEHLRLLGVMAIPPAGVPEETRRYFRQLRLLRDHLGLEHVSMGMTDDFETAIEEGATIIRVGRAIFGERG
jgi:pyridoxal phosphate enzyme (YggS family)